MIKNVSAKIPVSGSVNAGITPSRRNLWLDKLRKLGE
jgi:hypothetical protein